MISLNFKIEGAKGQFFDRAGVRDRLTKTTHRALSKAGAFVRRGARSSIRKAKKISSPGQPPKSHTGRLKDFIFFFMNPAKLNVVVGPVRLNGGSPEGLKALEKGGAVHSNKKTFRYRARPFMKPALEREIPKFPDLWGTSGGK